MPLQRTRLRLDRTGASTVSRVLKTRIEGVYRQTGPSVMFVSSTVVQHDVFMQPVPQEGSGRQIGLSVKPEERRQE